MKYILLLLLPIFSFSQDSLYTNSDAPSTPATYSKDGPAELGLTFRATSSGYVNVVRYYTSTDGIYNATLWNDKQQKVSTTSFRSIGREWNRVVMPTVMFIDSGKQYTVSITTPYNYDSRSQALASPLIKGKLIGLKGTWSHIPGSYPTAIYDNVSYYITPVFIRSLPLNVSVIPEISIRWPVDSVQLGAQITGDLAEVRWSEKVDTLINDSLVRVNRVISFNPNPVVKPKLQENTYVVTVKDKYGNVIEKEITVKYAKPILVALSDGTWITVGNIIVDPETIYIQNP
jgi:hypothetical protein